MKRPFGLVALTYFTDFVAASGLLSRFNVVRDTLGVGFDYWLELRRALVAMHRDGCGLQVVFDAVENAGDRSENFRESADAYLSWIFGKKVAWFQPTERCWETPQLRVTVNPELGLVIEGIPHYVKLYMRKEKLSRRKREATLELLAITHQEEIQRGAVVAVLDVRRQLLHSSTKTPNKRIDAVLEGDAAAFRAILDGLAKGAIPRR